MTAQTARDASSKNLHARSSFLVRHVTFAPNKPSELLKYDLQRDI